MNEQSAKQRQVEDEIDERMLKRIYTNGVSELNDELRELLRRILSTCKDMAISTLRDDGWPQVNTVGFVSMGEDIYFETFNFASKAKNIERDPRVSIAIWPRYESVVEGSGISMAAYAEKVTEAAVAEEFHRLLLEKFPEIAEITYEDGDRVYPDPNVVQYRLRPTVISLLDFTKGFGHADLVVVGDETGGEAARDA